MAEGGLSEWAESVMLVVERRSSGHILAEAGNRGLWLAWREQQSASLGVADMALVVVLSRNLCSFLDKYLNPILVL